MRRAFNALVGYVRSASAKKYAVVCLAAMLVAALAAVSRGFGSDPAGTDQSDWSGKAAPDFALSDLSGKTVRLSDFKGKVVLPDFWATWCGPCREEIPEFVQLQKQYAGKGFTMMGIALDDEGASVVKPFAQKLGMNYPVVIGNIQVASAYGGIQAIPLTFLIGRDGKILKTYLGARDKSEFQQDIQSALQTKSPTNQSTN